MVGEFSTERKEPGIRRDCSRACRLTGGMPTGGDVQRKNAKSGEMGPIVL